MRQLCKGNVAIVKGAVLAGCRGFYGYPITPASEIAEYAALLIPEVGGTFLQAESEVSAINMVYGAASAGVRVMTASSGPGLSLMQEGICYLAGSELPCVIVDVVRGGPGLGNIAPEQSDYFCVRQGRRPRLLSQHRAGAGLGAGDVRPHHPGVRARRPVSQSRRHHDRRLCRPDDGAARYQVARDRAAGESLGGEGHAGDEEEPDQLDLPEPDALEAHVRKLEAKYQLAQELETPYETYMTEDAEVLLVGLGIVSRVLRSTVDQRARKE